MFQAGANDRDVELWEIAENLHRADLTALERDEQISRWVRLVADRKSKTAAQSEEVSDKLSETSKGGRPGVSASAARDLGINERDVQRATKVDSIAPKAKAAARAAGIADNRSALLKVAKEPTAAKQVKAVRSLAQQKRDTSIAANVKERATREVAAIIFEHVPAQFRPAIKANLGVCGPTSAIIKAIEAREAKAK